MAAHPSRSSRSMSLISVVMHSNLRGESKCREFEIEHQKLHIRVRSCLACRWNLIFAIANWIPQTCYSLQQLPCLYMMHPNVVLHEANNSLVMHRIKGNTSVFREFREDR